MTDAEISEAMQTLANQFADKVRAAVPSGARVDEWEGAFRWAMEKPDSVEVRAYAEKALAAAALAAGVEGMGR